MTMAPVVIQAIPIPSNDLSLDAADIDLLFPEGELNLVKRVVTKPAVKPAVKPVVKPAAKPAAKPPVVAKPAAKPVTAVKAPAKAPIIPVKAPAKAPVTPVKAPAKAPVAPVKAPVKAPATTPAKPPTAKPPAAVPVKNSPPPTGGKLGQGTKAPGGSADVCSVVERRNTKLDKRAQTNCKCFKKCNSCTANADCAFSTVTFTCVNKEGTQPNTIIKATAAKRCPAVQQQAGIFPSNGVASVPAGLPNARVQAFFTAIQPHVFTRESPARPDSGQHLKSVWIANHTGAKAVPTCNTTTGLCTFVDGSATGKTVWDDTTGIYSQQDVKNMCSVALALTDSARATTETRHVILTPLNVKICVDATKQSANFNANTGAGQGSCFPVGTGAATGLVHSAC